MTIGGWRVGVGAVFEKEGDIIDAFRLVVSWEGEFSVREGEVRAGAFLDEAGGEGVFLEGEGHGKGGVALMVAGIEIVVLIAKDFDGGEMRSGKGEVERGAALFVGFGKIGTTSSEKLENGKLSFACCFANVGGSGCDFLFFEFSQGNLRIGKVSAVKEV